MNSTYKGIKLIHDLDSIPLIKKVVSNFNPELIMEIGTAYGGLTLVFHDACPKAEIHTYDPFRKVNSEKFGSNVYFHNEDAFKSNLYDLCKSNKRKFLFCDGFDKKKELLIFGPLLNSGDMIGVHDYPTRLWEDWERGKNPKKIKQIIHPEVKDLLNGFIPLEANKEFEKKQKSIFTNSYSDRYWIKE